MLDVPHAHTGYAEAQAVVNPENTFFSVKRFIGRRMDEVNEESKVRKFLGLATSSNTHDLRLLLLAITVFTLSLRALLPPRAAHSVPCRERRWWQREN